jgi:hypothetical protein
MSPVEGKDDRLRAALASLAELQGDGDDCPSAAAIWDSATEALGTGEANRRVILHTVKCSACASAWRLARRIAQSEPGMPAVVRSTPSRRWIPLAAAAVLALVAIGLGIWLAPDGVGIEPAYRIQEKKWLESALPEGSSLPREQCDLRWTAGPDGTTYDVNVTAEDLELVVRAFGLDRPEYRIDPHVLEGVPDGAGLLWRVTAHLPDGRRVTSRTFLTRLD